MTAFLAIFLQFAPYLIKAADSVPEIIDYFAKVREAADQSGEMTDAQEAQFDAYLDELDAKFKSQLNTPPTDAGI